MLQVKQWKWVVAEKEDPVLRSSGQIFALNFKIAGRMQCLIASFQLCYIFPCLKLSIVLTCCALVVWGFELETP